MKKRRDHSLCVKDSMRKLTKKHGAAAFAGMRIHIQAISANPAARKEILKGGNLMEYHTNIIYMYDYVSSYDIILTILAFLIWLWSLIVLIIVKKNNSSSPEIIGLKKWVTGLNIALICVTVGRIYCFRYYHTHIMSLIGLAMLVLATLCINDSIRLFKMRLQAKRQLGQQNYRQQSYIPPQQEQAAPQPQQQQQQQQPQQEQAQQPQQPQPQQQQDTRFCPNCGTELQEDSCFCTQCGTQI